MSSRHSCGPDPGDDRRPCRPFGRGGGRRPGGPPARMHPAGMFRGVSVARSGCRAGDHGTPVAGGRGACARSQRAVLRWFRRRVPFTMRIVNFLPTTDLCSLQTRPSIKNVGPGWVAQDEAQSRHIGCAAPRDVGRDDRPRARVPPRSRLAPGRLLHRKSPAHLW